MYHPDDDMLQVQRLGKENPMIKSPVKDLAEDICQWLHGI